MKRSFAGESRLRVSIVILVAATCMLFLFSTSSRAEFYFGGAIGGNFPLDFSDVELTGVGAGASSTDLSLEDSLSYGGKVGYFFPSVNWFGIELEAYNTNPNINQQQVTVVGTVLGIPINGTGTIAGADVRIITGAANFVARYPGNRVEPYIGVGPGVFFAEVSSGGTSDTVVVPGVNAIAGARFFLADWVALFTEYKFNYARFNFDGPAVGFKATYLANHVHGGISFHFK